MTYKEQAGKRWLPLSIIVVAAAILTFGCSAPFGMASYLDGDDLFATATVVVDSPAFGTTPTAPVATIRLTAEVVGAPVAASHVEFFAGSRKIGEDASAPFEITISNATGAYYDFRAEAVFDSGRRVAGEARRMELDAFVGRVAVGQESTVPAAEPEGFFLDRGAIPTGYLVDTGEPYGDRGNGFSYGWSSNYSGNSNAGSNRNLPDMRYVNYIKMGSAPISWQIAVPNGDYYVRVAAGRNSWNFKSEYVHLMAEGTAILDQATTNDAFYIEGELETVTVSDGAFTLSQGSSGSNNTNFYFVEVITSGTDYQPPTAPTELSSDMRRSHSLQLHWRPSQDNTSVRYYRIYQDGALVGTSEGPRFFVGGLSPDSRYDFEVTAVDVFGNESEAGSIGTRTAAGEFALARLTSSTITVDASAGEAAWSVAQAYKIDNRILGDGSFGYPDGDADLSGTLKVLWDATNLYFFIDVADDALFSDVGDKLEIYLDLDNGRTLGYDLDDIQLSFAYDSITSS
ncbi:MAG: sugar-binding protein, partial [Spirochaetales bacterium]